MAETASAGRREDVEGNGAGEEGAEDRAAVAEEGEQSLDPLEAQVLEREAEAMGGVEEGSGAENEENQPREGMDEDLSEAVREEPERQQEARDEDEGRGR